MITLDQAMARAREASERFIADQLRSLETDLVLAEVDPDDIDAMVAESRAKAERGLTAQLESLRAQLTDWLGAPSGEGGASGC